MTDPNRIERTTPASSERRTHPPASGFSISASWRAPVIAIAASVQGALVVAVPMLDGNARVVAMIASAALTGLMGALGWHQRDYVPPPQ